MTLVVRGRPDAQAGPGTIVEVSYELYDAEGELVEASYPGAPLVFLFGYGQAVPALERALEGLCSGEARRVRLQPEDGFGPRDDAAIFEVSRDERPDGTGVRDVIEAETEEGSVPVPLRVLDMSDDMAVLDANHPLAGQVVDVDLVVDAVRFATSAELAEAEAALEESGGVQGMRTLIPAERLLKRSHGERPS